MFCILNIETSTTACSVALSCDKEIVYKEESLDGPLHASLLGVFVNNAVTFSRTKGFKIDAVAVSCGPGSYTGLRIGVSEAKGLCYGLGIPLIAINTLLLMADKVARNETLSDDVLLCPMIDARRMEVYAGIYDQKLSQIREIQADIVDENSYKDYLKEEKVAFFGNGAAKCKEYLSHANSLFLDDVFPLASDMANLAQKAFDAKNFVDIAYFEPFYLKEFVATTPKNKVLG